jgi:purine-nucleoside phosphorylase
MGRAGGLSGYGTFLCKKAIRDEGTSYHYTPPSKYAYPDERLTKRLEDSLKENNIEFRKAINWTIDSIFRETKKEIEQYKNEGVTTVDMEASALFAVAGVREAKIAAAFVVSDVFFEGGWERGRDKLSVKKDLIKLTDAVVDCFTYQFTRTKKNE